MKLHTPAFSIRFVLSWLLILGLFSELGLRVVTTWKEPKGRFTWMLGKNRLEVLSDRDGYRFFTGKKGTQVEFGPMKFYFNNLGYRSKHSEILPKAEGVFRVACFGDSVTLGQYDWDYYDTWPGAMERILNTYHPLQEIEVLNFGLAHYTHVTNLVNLALIGNYIQPDIVILLIGPNDFVCLYTKDYAPDGSQDGKWLLPITDAIWGFHPIGIILSHSRVGTLIYGYAAKGILFLQAKKMFTMHLSEETLQPRLEIMGRHLASICALSRGLGAAPVLCAYLYDEKRLLENRGKDFPHVLQRIDDTIREVAIREGAILVEANDRMKSRQENFRDDFHLTAKGGEVFAGIVIEILKQKGLLPLETSSSSDMPEPESTKGRLAQREYR